MYGAVHRIRWDGVVIVNYATTAAGPGCTMAVTHGEQKKQNNNNKRVGLCLEYRRGQT